MKQYNCIMRSFITCTLEDYMGRLCSTNRKKRNAYSVLVGKSKRKSPLSSSRRRRNNNTRLYLRDIVEVT
jgi:hypothetical protein